MRSVIGVCAAIAGIAFACPARAVERPPQFVVMAFDNCSELERWKELIDFAAEMNAEGDRLHFTFFVSGINFLSAAHRKLYEGPRHRRGASNIYFGGTPADVRRRVAYVNTVRRAGHEIASHAVGHFNGAGWSAEDWAYEFQTYQRIFDNVARYNTLPDDVKFEFSFGDVIGFRAPYLARNDALYPALAATGFRYDASASNKPSAWPEKRDSLWRFNLARIPVSGLGKRTLSMDYNFLIAQSRGRADPERFALYRDQMLQSYVDYFYANYTGNRAPVHIGHHFSDYQGGAYREALKSFARLVCGLPEVRCVSYRTLADYLDGQSPATLAAYRKGEFPRLGDPAEPAIASASHRASHRASHDAPRRDRAMP
jgi:peptidoglycan/xylan/chitin deacetylase (PgdA/CDA1 family)